MEIEWSVRARTDIEDLKSYIAKDSPIYARRFADRIFTAVEKLISHPQIGRVVPEANREDVREIIFEHYRIIYLVKPNKVFIVTIIHGSRELLGKLSLPGGGG